VSGLKRGDRVFLVAEVDCEPDADGNVNVYGDGDGVTATVNVADLVRVGGDADPTSGDFATTFAAVVARSKRDF
jgi:hypothetical protein